jgi:two-component system sensor histidine kinase ChvG
VLIVAVPLVGIGFARFYEREMLVGLESDMVHQGELLRHVLLADPSGLRLDERQGMLAAAARETRTRIRLLDGQGKLLADSHWKGPPEGREHPPSSLLPLSVRSELSSLEDYSTSRRAAPVTVPISERPEVQAAMHGHYGAATRIWQGGNLVYLFSALPIQKDGQVVGVVYVTRTTVPVRLAMRRLRKTLFEVLALTLAATAVITVFLAGTISRPLSQLTRRAERIARGERDVSLELDRKDEIGQLARAFDTMAAKLDARARYVGELAANISHEFKSPLTGIRGAAELLLEGAADDPAARARFLDNILADANRLDRLVSRLLELARYESDAAPLDEIDYPALVREVAAASRGVPVKVSYEARVATVTGRRVHLVSALANLIENAQQHAAAGSTITVRVTDAPRGKVETSVHNDGNAISEANLAKVWERFFTTRGGEGGTGLGLPIVATVIASHGGTVGVRSSPAEGTTFRFDLPVA